MATLRLCPHLTDEQFALTVTQIADLFSMGFDETLGKGGTGEYAESREFQPGDSLRTVDWRATALTDRLMTRVYGADWCLSVVVVVDQSASMTLSSKQPGKYETAVRLAGGLAHAALRTMRPTVLAGSEAAVFPRASLQREALTMQLLGLREYRPGSARPLARLLEHGLPAHLGRCLVFALTDLTLKEDAAAIAALARAHQVITFVLRDGAEQGLGGAGYMRAHQAEAPRTSVIRGCAAPSAAAYDEAVRRSGVALQHLGCGASTFHDVRRWLEEFRHVRR